MADTNFVAGEQIPLAWIQDVNNAVYRGLSVGGAVPTTLAQTLANLGGANQGGNSAIQFSVAAATGANQAPNLAQVQALIAAAIPTSGVTSFNTRTGAVSLTSTDVTTALGYTPANAASGVSSFNTRTGAVTLTSGDVTGALGFIPLGPIPTIAVIGDSLSSPNGIRRRSWIRQLGQMLNEAGSPAKVLNFAIGGQTFYRANTTASFGTNTTVQECIAASPSVIIVMMGADDVLIQGDGRTVAQIESDAQTLYNALRAGLPNAKLIYVSELCYDSANFTATSIKNKGVVPYFQSLATTGILAGSYSPEILENYLASAQQTLFSNWSTFDTYCKGLGWDGLITYNHFQTCRLGLTLPDLLHVQSEGTMLIASQILHGLAGLSFMPTYFPTIATSAGIVTADALALFGTILTASADGYTSNTTQSNVTGEDYVLEDLPLRAIQPDTWFYPYRGTWYHSPSAAVSYAAKQQIIDVLHNWPPNAAVQVSVNGGAFANTAYPTDALGYMVALSTSQDLGGTGSFVLRYKVGNQVTAPFTVTINA